MDVARKRSVRIAAVLAIGVIYLLFFRQVCFASCDM